jgi:hypothetical protein
VRSDAPPKVVAAGHDRLSTFALLKDESTAAIRGYRAVVGGGYLRRDGDPYPSCDSRPPARR